MKAVVTQLLFSQVSKFSLIKYIVTLITSKTGVMPELAPEGEANSSDGLHTVITFVEDSVQIARLAEEIVLENNIIKRYSSLTHRALQAVFMPGQHLAIGGVHFHPT